MSRVGIQQQPAPGYSGRQQQNWMQAQPTSGSGAPPGLEYLSMLNCVLIQQKVDMVETLVGWQGANKYSLHNSAGQQCYYAVEQSDEFGRQFAGSFRDWTMHVLDNGGNEVLRMMRDDGKVVVTSPQAGVMGIVAQQGNCCSSRFVISDAMNQPQLFVAGPRCVRDCGNNTDFNVFAMSTGAVVGQISKTWSNFAQEVFTDANNFGVSCIN